MAKLHVYAAGSTAGVMILLTWAQAGEAEVLKKARPMLRERYLPTKEATRMRNCHVNDPRGSLGHPSAKSSYDRIDPFGMAPVSDRPHGVVIAHPMTPGLLAI
jgi:hypothetical protein